jgi:hypothetical protein
VIETPNNHFISNFTLWCNFAGERETKVVPSCLSFPFLWDGWTIYLYFHLKLSLSLSQLKWVFMLFYISPPNLPFWWANFFKKKFPFSNLFLYWMCGNKSFMQPMMRRFSMHSWRVQFFSLWGGVSQGAIFLFLFFLILNVFSSCSHGVPQVVPNSITILSHMVCPKFNSDVYKVKRWAIGERICVFFWDWGSKEVLLMGRPQCSKKIGDGGNQCCFLQKEKKCERTHEPINMSQAYYVPQ